MTVNLFSRIVFFLCILLCNNSTEAQNSKEKQEVRIHNLKSEYTNDPIGIDVAPQFSWCIESDARGVKQTSYRILVASSPDNLSADIGDVWDSGIVNSTKSTGIQYGGIELFSRKRYYWKIGAKIGGDNRDYLWSAPAFFEMALLKQEDWKSGWIGYVPGMPGRVLYFKGTFHPQKTIKTARTYIAGLGYYELYINKKKVGDHILDPAQSTYSKRIYYATYDVKDYFTEEANSIVVAVAPGWLGSPRLRAQIEVVYEDGSTDILTSDRLRSVITGPTVYSTIFDGEHYDARLENEDIHKPWVPQGLMNEHWAWAHNTDDPAGNMEAQKVEPIRVVETLTPISIKEPTPGVYVLDAGRNLAGWASLKVKGERGTEIKLQFAETLYENGLINKENLRNAKVEDTYTFRGGEEEIWEPAFTYHGFRYLQIEGLPYTPSIEDFKIKVVRSDVKQSGSFTCSNTLLNDIHQMIVNTEASNLHSVPTDCPQRDERMGWLNDMTVRIEQAIYNFNLSRFYPKFMDDVQDTQAKDGTVTCVAPFRFGMRPADPVSASYLLLALKCYEFYGDYRIISDHFDGMKAWVDYLNTRTKNNIVEYSYYGDWCPPRDFLMSPNGSGVSRDTPGNLISTGYLHYCARILSDMAKIIGRETEALHYKKLADEIGEAFNREYWNEDVGGYGANNQACNSFALYMNLVSEEKKSRVISNLVEDVKKHDYHLTTGNLCTKYLLEVLVENGHPEVAYKIATQTTYPSWGFMLSKGATTLWERWEYATGDAMNSHNHPMMGSVGSWFYRYILGITPQIEYPAFEQFNIRPVIFQDLSFAEGSLDTEKGLIKSAWKKEGKRLKFNISIPGNTTAIVYVPTKNIKTIKESGKSVSKIKSIEYLRQEGDYAIFRIGSGDYNLNSEWM